MNTTSHRSYLLKAFYFLAIWIFSSVGNQAVAAPIVELDEQDLRITLEQSTGDNYHLHFTSLSGGTVNVSTFILTEPPRLVVDVAGVKLGSSRTVAITHPSLTAMRVGVHPDKTRIVVDINGSVAPVYSKSGSGSNVTVDFNIAGETPLPSEAGTQAELKTEKPALDSVAKIEEPSVATSITVDSDGGLEVTAKLPEQGGTPSEVSKAEVEITDPEVEKPKKPEVIYDPPITQREKQAKEIEKSAVAVDDTDTLDVAAFAKEDLKPSVSSEPKPKPDNSKPTKPSSRIEGLLYKMLNGSTPALMIKVTSLGEYSFRKRDKNIFEVILANSLLAGDHLTQPHFPSEEFKGLEGTFMWQRDNSVVIKIYVEPGVHLTPYRADGNLWIKVAK